MAMAAKSRHQKSAPAPAFKIGDRVIVRFGPGTSCGTVVEDRGLIGAGGRRLYRVKVDFDPPNVTFTELPEDDLTLAN